MFSCGAVYYVLAFECVHEVLKYDHHQMEAFGKCFPVVPVLNVMYKGKFSRLRQYQ